MSAAAYTLPRLRTEEGFRGTAYRDTVGRLTIGYGSNIDAGWSQGLAEAVLEYQLNDVQQQVARFWWWTALDDIRASVVLDMAFNGGVTGLLHYPKMLAAIGAKNWPIAHDELLNSDAARMLPLRYQALAKIMLSGTA